MEYGKIETLYERDEKFKVVPGKLKNRTYSLLKTWHWTEKIDGTNIRCICDQDRVTFGGKTDNTQIHVDLVTWLMANITREKMMACFPKKGHRLITKIKTRDFSYDPLRSTQIPRHI